MPVPATPLILIPIAAILSYALNALAVRGRLGAKLLDQPNERSLHARAVPRIGGLGIVAGSAAGLLAGGDFVPVILLALALAAVSLVDDWRHLPPAVRLLAHLAAASAFCLADLAAGVAVLAVAVVAIGWMTNLYNFMDGSDGLAGGMAVFGFGTYAIAALLAGDPALATVCGCIVAAAAAFLRFNFHPARIFMGDVGSIPLGFLAGALGLIGTQRQLWPWWFPPVVFAPFVADATVTLLRRIARGERVWQPHRSHYYQRLVLLGWGHRRTALAEYTLMALSGGVAILAARATGLPRILSLAALGVVYILAALTVDRRWAAFALARQL